MPVQEKFDKTAYKENKEENEGAPTIGKIGSNKFWPTKKINEI